MVSCIERAGYMYQGCNSELNNFVFQQQQNTCIGRKFGANTSSSLVCWLFQGGGYVMVDLFVYVPSIFVGVLCWSFMILVYITLCPF